MCAQFIWGIERDPQHSLSRLGFHGDDLMLFYLAYLLLMLVPFEALSTKALSTKAAKQEEKQCTLVRDGTDGV